jgi:hypothetical protein
MGRIDYWEAIGNDARLALQQNVGGNEDVVLALAYVAYGKVVSLCISYTPWQALSLLQNLR